MNRNLRRYLFGQLICQAGNWIGMTASMWLVVNELRLNAFHNSLLFCAGVLIGLVGNLLGPRLLRRSRWSVHTWLVTHNVLSALFAVAVAVIIIYLESRLVFMVLLGVKMLHSALSIMSVPAATAYMRGLASADEVYAAQVRMSRNLWLTRAVSGVGTAAVISYFSIATAILIDGVTFVVLAIILLSLPRDVGAQDATVTAQPEERWWRKWCESIDACLPSGRLVLVLGVMIHVQLIFFLSFFYCAEIISVRGAQRFTFHGEEFALSGIWVYGLHLTITGIAGVAGTSVARRLEKRSRTVRVRVFIIHAMLMPCLIALAAYSPDIWMFVAIQVIVSFLASPLTTLAQYELTRHEPLAAHASAVQSFFQSGLLPLLVIAVTGVTRGSDIPARVALTASGVAVFALLLVWLAWMYRHRRTCYKELFTVPSD